MVRLRKIAANTATTTKKKKGAGKPKISIILVGPYLNPNHSSIVVKLFVETKMNLPLKIELSVAVSP